MTIKQLPRIRTAEDICENCLYCHVGELKGSLDIRSQKVLECRKDAPENVYTNQGVMVQPKMTIPGYWCSFFSK